MTNAPSILVCASRRCRHRRLCRLRSRLSPQDRRRDQRDHEANREWLDECEGCIEERLVVQFLVLSQVLNLRLDSRITRARGPSLLDDIGAVFVHKAGQEVEIQNFPGYDIANTRNQGNGDPNSKGFRKRDLTVADVVAVRTYTEE